MINFDWTFYVTCVNLLLIKHKFINFDWIANGLIVGKLLKELENCILCTIPAWWSFWSIRIHKSLNFLLILGNLVFCLSMFFHISVLNWISFLKTSNIYLANDYVTRALWFCFRIFSATSKNKKNCFRINIFHRRF